LNDVFKCPSNATFRLDHHVCSRVGVTVAFISRSSPLVVPERTGEEFIRAVPNSIIGGQINTTFLVEFLLDCGIRGRW